MLATGVARAGRASYRRYQLVDVQLRISCDRKTEEFPGPSASGPADAVRTPFMSLDETVDGHLWRVHRQHGPSAGGTGSIATGRRQLSDLRLVGISPRVLPRYFTIRWI